MENFNLEIFKNLTSDNPDLNVNFLPLNFDRLKEIGAFRVTHQGLPDGTYNPDPKAGFSLVSKYNDLVNDTTTKWKNNPEALNVVKNLFLTDPSSIGAHKYLQIVESARQLGLKDEDIFFPASQNFQKVKFVDPFGDTTKD